MLLQLGRTSCMSLAALNWHRVGPLQLMQHHQLHCLPCVLLEEAPAGLSDCPCMLSNECPDHIVSCWMQYNTIRMFFTCAFGLVLGSIYWRIGTERCEHPAAAASGMHDRP